MLKELVQLGLSDEEARVYLANLEIGGAPVSLIAKKAGIHRVSCYHTIENLIKKRLLSQYNKNGIKYYAPEPPDQIQKIAEEKVNVAKSLVPQLSSIINTYGFKPKIRFYEGKEGIKRVFTESLESKGEILRFSNLKILLDLFPELFEEITREKLKKKIKTRILSPNTLENTKVLEKHLPKNYDKNLIEVLLVNKNQFLFENEILIFGNKVGIVSLQKEELLGLIVESPTFSRSMKAVFDLAWLGATAFIAK